MSTLIPSSGSPTREPKQVTVELRSDGSAFSKALLELIRKAVRDSGEGGPPQVRVS